MAKITGRIIRIVDNRTAIINLGLQDGINEDSIFHILGEPETIIDPFSKEELGTLRVVKSKLKAQQVYERFTVATTQWTITVLENKLFSNARTSFSKMFTVEERLIDKSELRVSEEDIQPWKATAEEAVRVGDYVEVEIEDQAEEDLGEAVEVEQEAAG